MRGTTGTNLRRRLAVAAVTALGAVATLAPATGAKVDKPPKQHVFRGYVQGFVTVQFAPGFPYVRSTFGGRCSVPSDWMTNWSGSGTSTQTGKISAYGSDCDRFDPTTNAIEYGDGVITEWGANGDFIYATYTNGHGTLGGTIIDEWTITGGTGKFAGATGHGFEEFILLAPPNFSGEPIPFRNPWDGWIAMDKDKD